MTDVLAALLPSIGVTVLFVVGIRALVQADRRERAARAVLEPPAAGSAAADDGVHGALDSVASRPDAEPAEAGDTGEVDTGEVDSGEVENRQAH